VEAMVNVLKMNAIFYFIFFVLFDFRRANEELILLFCKSKREIF